jgi:hypothetical protein
MAALTLWQHCTAASLFPGRGTKFSECITAGALATIASLLKLVHRAGGACRGSQQWISNVWRRLAVAETRAPRRGTSSPPPPLARDSRGSAAAAAAACIALAALPRLSPCYLTQVEHLQRPVRPVLRILC